MCVQSNIFQFTVIQFYTIVIIIIKLFKLMQYSSVIIFFEYKPSVDLEWGSQA